jgi:hypothetical protein
MIAPSTTGGAQKRLGRIDAAGSRLARAKHVPDPMQTLVDRPRLPARCLSPGDAVQEGFLCSSQINNIVFVHLAMRPLDRLLSLLRPNRLRIAVTQPACSVCCCIGGGSRLR